jgi:hypothetical protein
VKKNRPKRERQYKKPKTRKQKPFNPWIAKYFDLLGNGLENSKRWENDDPRYNEFKADK